MWASKALSRTSVKPHLDTAAVESSEVPQSSCGREGTRKVVACIGFEEKDHSPTPPLPKKRPDFVEEDGGGGFWICEAVGARLCRIEYVRCMMMMMSCVTDQRGCI